MGSSDSGPAPPLLFTLRLWREVLGKEHFEWRGRIELVHTGEVRYFRVEAAFFSWLTAQFGGLDGLDPNVPLPLQVD